MTDSKNAYEEAEGMIISLININKRYYTCGGLNEPKGDDEFPSI